jgi:4-alpha-glucanotransferase
MVGARARAGELTSLRALARAAGIQTRYQDGLGRQRTPPPETLLAILRSLGHDVDSAAGAPSALRALKQSQSQRLCEPVVVAWGGIAPPITLRIPEGPVEVRLELEDGSAEYSLSRPRPLRRLQLPAGLPLGVHRLTIESRRNRAIATVLSAPWRCYEGEDEQPRRELGIFLPLYALRSRRSWGVGDLTDLDALTRWAGSLGCNLIGTLPLLASYLAEPFEPSPYAPVSRLHWNELFADLTAAPDFPASAAARRTASSAAFARELAELRSRDLVDYRRCYALKRRVLEQLAKAAFRNAGRRRALEALMQDEPTLEDYARFRACADRTGTTWQQWRAGPRAGRLAAADYDQRDFQTHLYAQLLMRQQLAEQARLARRRGGRLYLDLPLGAHGGGYDLWRFREHFMADLSVGAPPDVMFTHGQNWGFPPLHPGAVRQLGHAYFIAAIRNHLRFAGALRIDHIMGLHRLFCIPRGMEGEQGAYINYPHEELYAILSIESHRARARIIGENLGTVPPQVTATMEERGILGMWVGQFAIGGDPRSIGRTLARPGASNLASLNTHDIPPFAAHWRGEDISMRQRFGWLKPEQARQEVQGREQWQGAILQHLRGRGLLRPARASRQRHIPPHEIARRLILELAQSNAEIVLVNLEDLWGETRPQNIPGISEGYPNWQRTASRTLEQMMRQRGVADILRQAARR